LQKGDDWVITQKTPVDEVWDSRQASGIAHTVQADSRVTNRWSRTR
jgi:frataxin-like iron-binding protein CyaY